jgi:hypothetical protein
MFQKFVSVFVASTDNVSAVYTVVGETEYWVVVSKSVTFFSAPVCVTVLVTVEVQVLVAVPSRERHNCDTSEGLLYCVSSDHSIHCAPKTTLTNEAMIKERNANMVAN